MILDVSSNFMFTAKYVQVSHSKFMEAKNDAIMYFRVFLFSFFGGRKHTVEQLIKVLWYDSIMIFESLISLHSVQFAWLFVYWSPFFQ